MTDNLNKLKEVIQAANPDKDWFPIKASGIAGVRDGRVDAEPIRLSDVLLAIGDKILLRVDTEGFFHTWEKEDADQGRGYSNEGVNWNLKDDNLDNQSDETINFLTNLLCK